MYIDLGNRGALLYWLFTLLVDAITARSRVNFTSNCIGWLCIKGNVCLRDFTRWDWRNLDIHTSIAYERLDQYFVCERERHGSIFGWLKSSDTSELLLGIFWKTLPLGALGWLWGGSFTFRFCVSPFMAAPPSMQRISSNRKQAINPKRDIQTKAVYGLRP
jgi:hypothetical protein